MRLSFLDRHQNFKDALGIVIFVVCVLIGTLFINTFIFRSFNVSGRSMEVTMHDGDRLIVNRLPVTWSQLQNKPYIPERGQIIVFKNPKFDESRGKEEYIVKRVIAFEGERVSLSNGKYTVYNGKYPAGFNPDDDNNGEPGSPTSGTLNNEIVPEGTLFVSGDHRQDSYSYDSRNGLGYIPLYDVVGPVSLRIFPFNQIRSFK
ncbi:MAG TPA: signal peptidase I [Candidatus Saccharimonadales bacterium]